MEVKATAKTLRIQPRKARLVLNLIRGKDVEEAAAICKFLPNKGGAMVGKVLKSAVANAVNNHDLDEDKLYVKACWADEGITMKRYMPRAKGSASPITQPHHRGCGRERVGGPNGSESKSDRHACRHHPRLAVPVVCRR